MKNIVFIGMPGSGKTTISRQVAKSLGRPWYDSDREVEAQEHMSITALFAEKGEEHFRQKETECIRLLMRQEGIVLAVGGGAVLHNAGILRVNSTVIYLDRSIERILSTLEAGTRPLLSSTDKLYTLYNERHKLYQELCDYKIANEGSIEETKNKILEALA